MDEIGTSDTIERGVNGFRIASWNVHMGLHNDGGRNDLVTECKRLDADILVLQEAWWYGEDDSDLAERVAAALGGELYRYTSPTTMRRYPAKWTVAIISTLPAERIEDAELVSMFGRERKMPRIRLIDSGIVIAGAHLDGIHAVRTRPDLWIKQRRAFREHAAENDIIAGDLNMWSPVVNRDARPLRNAIQGATWPAHRPHSQIDHILASERLGVVESSVLENCGSDHLAVRATLRIR